MYLHIHTYMYVYVLCTYVHTVAHCINMPRLIDRTADNSEPNQRVWVCKLDLSLNYYKSIIDYIRRTCVRGIHLIFISEFRAHICTYQFANTDSKQKLTLVRIKFTCVK